MATNDFVPFCNENTGTNLPTQSAYIANPNLPIGNQPGIASSSFNNKPLRQATTIAAVMAQVATEFTGADMLDNQNTADHAIPAALRAAMIATLKRQSPVITSYLSGSGNHNMTYKFQIASGSATAAATYSDGTTTYTVSTTVASGTQLDATGAAAPAVSGTLTKLSGTGDATITYYAVRAPLYLRIRAVGAGGGGAGTGTGTSFGNGGQGGDTTFGVFTAGGGGAGTSVGGGGGGIPTGGNVYSMNGASGQNRIFIATALPGTMGGISQLGGQAGPAEANAGNAATPVANSGCGGNGPGKTTGNQAGGAGGAGAYVEEILASPSGQYAYGVGAGGSAGAAGTSGLGGSAGAAGQIVVEEHYQ